MVDSLSEVGTLRPSTQARVQRVAQPVAEQVDAEGDHDQHRTGKYDEPPGPAEELLLAFVDEGAERGRGWRDADAEEGQRRFGEDGRGDLDRREHEHRPHD